MPRKNDHNMARSSSRTRSSNRSNNPIIVAAKFMIGRRIGRGNFGYLYTARDVDTNEEAAVKLESKSSKISQLSAEFGFYRSLSGVEGFPTVYHFGTVKQFNCLVMELLGPNLEELFQLCDKTFSLKTVLRIVLQLLDRFEYIHSKGILYRDVKPENFLVGRFRENVNVVHVVDFGLAKRYIDERTRKHIPYREGKNLTGTARYMSINTHLGREQSRRDDLESLGHLFAYLLRGRLPWQGIDVNGSVQRRYTMIGRMKMETSAENLFAGFPAEFATFLSYARNLEFQQDPDYGHMRRLFLELLLRKDLEDDGQVDWDDKVVTGEHVQPQHE